MALEISVVDDGVWVVAVRLQMPARIGRTEIEAEAAVSGSIPVAGHVVVENVVVGRSTAVKNSLIRPLAMRVNSDRRVASAAAVRDEIRVDELPARAARGRSLGRVGG